MAQPHESVQSYWHHQALVNNNEESNPVITPYKHVDAQTLYDENGVTIKKRLVTMKDGEQYFVTSSESDKYIPDGLDGLAHYEGVAFTTQPEGLYVERLKKLAEIGFVGSVFSVPDNVGLWISYDKNVQNYLSLANNEAYEHGRDPELINLSGISQGSMNGFGIIEKSKEHNMNVVAAHLSVPCLPDGIHNKKYLVGHVLETLAKTPFEAFAIASIAKNMSREEISTLLPTIDRRKKALFIQAQMLRSLLSGGTGKSARNIDEDVAVLVELNGLDALSRAKRWQNSYIGDKSNVLIKHRPRGVHGDVINPIGQTNWVGYEKAVAEVLTENPSLRTDPKTAGANVLKIMRSEFPQFVKPEQHAA